MGNRENFELLRRFVDEMNSSNSTNHKVDTLSKYSKFDFIKKALYYTYQPYFNFGVTSSNLKKRQDLISEYNRYDDLFCLLDNLHNRVMTGHSAISAVNKFISENLKWADLIYQIIDRNLETRATVTLINRVIPNHIPTFEVALAHDAAKTKGVNILDGTWYVSRKLDGVRCICIIAEGEVKFFSRNGKEFKTLNKLAEEIKRLGITNLILDGEICLANEDGSDDFQGILKEIQRKDHSIQNPKYWVFDILTPNEFHSINISPNFSDRIKDRTELLGDISSTGILEVLPQILIENEESLDKLKKNSKDFNWEGLIAKRDAPYSPGRSKNMLKIKEFFDAEYTVTGVIMGPQRVIVEGKEIEEEMLSAVTIIHKGSTVQVGSGFSLDERRHYYRNTGEIIGKLIKVQYFESTIDQHGNHSLRFPVFKGLYGETRDF